MNHFDGRYIRNIGMKFIGKVSVDSVVQTALVQQDMYVDAMEVAFDGVLHCQYLFKINYHMNESVIESILLFNY